MDVVGVVLVESSSVVDALVRVYQDKFVLKKNCSTLSQENRTLVKVDNQPYSLMLFKYFLVVEVVDPRVLFRKVYLSVTLIIQYGEHQDVVPEDVPKRGRIVRGNPSLLLCQRLDN